MERIEAVHHRRFRVRTILFLSVLIEVLAFANVAIALPMDEPPRSDSAPKADKKKEDFLVLVKIAQDGEIVGEDVSKVDFTYRIYQKNAATSGDPQFSSPLATRLLDTPRSFFSPDPSCVATAWGAHRVNSTSCTKTDGNLKKVRR
jgi:hypothetical protein